MKNLWDFYEPFQLIKQLLEKLWNDNIKNQSLNESFPSCLAYFFFFMA